MSMEPHSHAYTLAWLTWFVVSVGWFLGMEIWALIFNWRDTLSANIWRMERFVPGQPIGHWTFAHLMFIGLLGLLFLWLLGHFAMGWWR